MNADMHETIRKQCGKGVCVEVNPTPWGYVIHSERVEKPKNGIGRLVRKAIGGILAVMALGIWAGQAGAGEPGIVVVKMGASALFIILAVILLSSQPRVERRAVRIDTRRRMLAVGRRTQSEIFTSHAQHTFDDIDMVLILPGSGRQTMPRLLVRVRDTSQALCVAEGPMAALEPLADQLARDLRAVRSGFAPVAQIIGSGKGPLVLGPRLETLASA